MNERIHCKLILTSLPIHLYQVTAGFKLLEQAKVIDLEIDKSVKRKPEHNMMTVIVDGRVRVLYDLDDGYIDMENGMAQYDRVLMEHDICFKRSFNAEMNAKLKFGKKIRPYGFNYLVTTKDNPANYPAPLDSWHDRFEKWIRLLPASAYGNRRFYVDAFEVAPRRQQSNNILFLTRVWELPKKREDMAEKDIHDYEGLNNFRSECILRCRKEFGKAFFGGLQPTPLAKEKFKEAVILESEIFKRHKYIERMKAAEICVATMGLYQSNGWKLAEYIAASKAIVTEKLFYEVPGDFSEPRNYLSFQSVDACVNQIRRLVDNAELRYQMKSDNYRYYHHYMRPDRIVLNSLLTLL